MPTYETGRMPNTDFKYEEFEGLLGSFHLSLLPLKHSTSAEDKIDYEKAMNILNRFAQKYRVQSPEDAVKNPRAERSWGNAHAFQTTWSMLDMMGSFWRDFGVGADPKTDDGQARYELGRLILGVYDRHGIAKVKFDTSEGQKVPVKLEQWNSPKDRKSLAEILRE